MTVAGTIVADAAAAEFRASGTDLSERRRSGVSRGPLIDIPPSPEMTGIAWDARGAARIGALTPIAAIAADARLDRGLSGHRRRGRRSGDAADPAFRHARRQSRPALALLVFSQSAHRLPEEGRRGLPGARGQSPLWRRLRSRPLRRAASFDDGGCANGL